MQDYTGDNRRAQVFHSHPITVKGIFLARNSLRSTMRVSQRNKISLALRVPSHVPHTTEKKSDPVYSTPARAISQSWLNKDSSNWGANRDGKHLLPEPGPCWPSGFCLWSAALAKPPSYKSSDETASQTPPGEYESSTPTLVEAQTHKQTSRPTNIYAPEQTDAAQILELNNNLAKKSFADNSVWAERKNRELAWLSFPLLHEEIWHIHISSGSEPNTSLNSEPDATFGLPIPLLYFPHLWREDDSLGLPDCI